MRCCAHIRRHRAAPTRLSAAEESIIVALFLYWGGNVQYWESTKSQTLYYGACGAALVLIALLYAITLTRHWGNRPRQKVRARAAAYRHIAHTAAKHGADLPEFYPHYGPYPFAATFHADAEELDVSGTSTR
ncbi:hypothetical protein ACGFZL_06370 [Streptomyces sp. NPDC048182]|uniref:hypothetical protein n=1 Tax=Streptomyces sp. NPDC048182 TaxID=3365507 RepID=UPI00371AF1B2